MSKLHNCYCSSELPCPILEHKYGTCAYCIVFSYSICVLTFLILIFVFYIIALMMYLKYINIMTKMLYY